MQCVAGNDDTADSQKPFQADIRRTIRKDRPSFSLACLLTVSAKITQNGYEVNKREELRVDSLIYPGNGFPTINH
jgi:hypothetical protein